MTQPAQIVPVAVPNTTGVTRSFGHLRLEIAGLEFTGGFKSFSLSRKRDREMVMSNNPDPVGKTLGENKYAAKGELYYDWWANTIRQIQQQLGAGYGDQPFTIYLSAVGTNLPPYTDTIIGCTFDSSEADYKAGVGALVVNVEFAPLKILFGGIDDLADPLF